MAAPRVELLWWSGCPSHGKARAMLAEAMTELGLDPSTIDSYQLVSDEEAAREHFIGSPTIRVDGVDILPPGADTPPTLTCRLYRRRDGRPSALPDPADIRDALTRAVTTA
jgi:hypothetical protein